MILRGIRARGLICLTIALLMALVVAGTVVAVAFGERADVSAGSAGAVILLGLVAIGAQVAESVRRREPEIALARLRGRRGHRLLFFTAVEPVIVIVFGAVVGAAGGLLAARWLVRRWLTRATPPGLDPRALVIGGLVALATVLLAIVVCWRTGRRPLVGQLVETRRPRSATAGLLFLQVLLILGAIVAIYQAGQAPGKRLDWVTLVSPAIVGLAAGQVLVWLIRAGLASAARRGDAGRLGWFLTVRRLARRADSLAVVRLVVAAGVVLAVAACAVSAATTWRQNIAGLQTGGPVSYPVASGALRAYAAAETADPQGRWLMPAAAYVDDSQGSDRRVFVATDRWDRVVGGFFADTTASKVGHAVATLPKAPSLPVVRTASVTAEVSTSDVRAAYPGLVLTIQYLNDAGDIAQVDLPLKQGGGAPAGPGLTRYTAKVSRCAHACLVAGLDAEGFTRPGDSLHLASLMFGSQPVIGPGSRFVPSSGSATIRVSPAGTGLDISMPRVKFYWYYPAKVVGRASRKQAVSVVTTPGIRFQTQSGRPYVQGTDGMNRPVHVTTTVPTIPFVGTRGSLGDLGTVLAGSVGTIPATHAVVIARADTPAKVLAALQATGSVGRPTTYQQQVDRLADTPRAQGTRLYALVALLAALIALIGMASAAAQQVRERRSEAASLRSVGVRSRSIGRAYRTEALLLAVGAAIGTAVAGWLAAWIMLPALPLTSAVPHVPTLDASPHTSIVVATAVAAGIAVALVVYAAFRRVARTARPRLLRESR